MRQPVTQEKEKIKVGYVWQRNFRCLSASHVVAWSLGASVEFFFFFLWPGARPGLWDILWTSEVCREVFGPRSSPEAFAPVSASTSSLLDTF